MNRIPTCAIQDCDEFAITTLPVHITGLTVTLVKSGRADKNIPVCQPHRTALYHSEGLYLKTKENNVMSTNDIGCECEIDWNCPLHQGQYTALEIQNDAASEQDPYDDYMEARLFHLGYASEEEMTADIINTNTKENNTMPTNNNCDSCGKRFIESDMYLSGSGAYFCNECTQTIYECKICKKVITGPHGLDDICEDCKTTKENTMHPADIKHFAALEKDIEEHYGATIEELVAEVIITNNKEDNMSIIPITTTGPICGNTKVHGKDKVRHASPDMVKACYGVKSTEVKSRSTYIADQMEKGSNVRSIANPYAKNEKVRDCHTCKDGTIVIGPITNGIPAGVRKCNCCAGKGYQTAADIKRDDYYHNMNDLRDSK